VELEPSALPPRRFVSSPPPAPPLPEQAPAAPEVARRSWAPAPPAAFVGAHEAAPRFEESLPPEPDEAESPPLPSPPEPLPPPPAAKRWSLFDFVRGKDARKVAAEPADADEALAPPQPDTHEPPPLAPTAIPDLDRVQRPYDRPQFDRSAPAMFDPRAPQEHMFEPPPQEPRPHEDFAQPMLEPSYDDDARPGLSPEGREPPPPQEDEYEYEPQDEEVRPRPTYRDLTKGLAIAGLVVSIGGLLLWQWPNMVSLYRSFRAPPVEATREAPPPATATRPKITDRIEPGTQQAPATPAPAPGGQTAAAPAAQKVVLYEEDPADPNGKRFVGSAIWRTEMVTPAPGQPPELAIRADVEVPERKLAMTWSLRRNTDKSLPATHTVEINFKLPPDFPSGGISNVPGILMKQAEQTRGVPLAGLAVKVTPGFYLIGLSNLDADKDRNLQLLKERGWFDIPVVYNNNRRAILAMEKGTPGERAFADAFKVWKQ
jgi:hypothetical protein